MQRILITGGTGYLGSTLVQRAHTRNVVVAATYYSQSPPRNSHSETHWLPLDVTDPLAVEIGVDMFQPDSVLHTAFRQNDPGLWDVTAGGALHVARAAAQSGARLIHLSSDVIFSGERDGAYTESDPPDPITAYGTAKADAERLVLEECPNAVVVRTSLIYGFHPIDRHTRFVLDVADGTQDAQLFTDEYRCPILVDDLAVALLELVSHSYEGIINVAGIERLSRYEFGTLLAQAHGRDPSRIGQGLSSESGLRRPRNCTLDVSLAQALLPTPLRGVREVLAAYAAGTL